MGTKFAREMKELEELRKQMMIEETAVPVKMMSINEGKQKVERRRAETAVQ